MHPIWNLRFLIRQRGWCIRVRLVRCAPSKDGDIVTRRQVETDQTTMTCLLIISVQQSANLVRLHAHNWIRLRIEIDPPVVDLHPDQVLIQLVSVTEEGLFADKL